MFKNLFWKKLRVSVLQILTQNMNFTTTKQYEQQQKTIFFISQFKKFLKFVLKEIPGVKFSNVN